MKFNEIPGNIMRNINMRVVNGLVRMQKMFTAYERILSPHGRETSSQVNRLLGAGVQGRLAQVEAQTLLDLMPVPLNLNIKKGGETNWFNWFELDCEMMDDRHFGQSCLESCHFCLEGRGSFIAFFDPLPVVIYKIVNKLYVAPPQNYSYDFMEWQDPFFNVSGDSVVKFENKTSPNSSGVRGYYTRGWRQSDQRAQTAAENIGKMGVKGAMVVSFHLGLFYPNIIKAIYEDQEHKVPEWIIQAYIAYYANVLKAISSSAWGLLVYFSDQRHALYNQATLRVLEAVVEPLEIFKNLTDPMRDFRDFLSNSDKSRSVFMKKNGYTLWGGLLRGDGRGGDFFTRLDQAFAGDKACLVPDKTLIDTAVPKKAYPLIQMNKKGRFQVV